MGLLQKVKDFLYWLTKSESIHDVRPFFSMDDDELLETRKQFESYVRSNEFKELTEEEQERVKTDLEEARREMEIRGMVKSGDE